MAPAIIQNSDEKQQLSRDSHRKPDNLIDEALQEEDSLGAIDLPIEPKDIDSGSKAYASHNKAWGND